MSIITYPLNGVTYDYNDEYEKGYVYEQTPKAPPASTLRTQITRSASPARGRSPLPPALRGSTTTTSRASRPAAGRRST